MPNKDKTGPEGKGSKTGKQFGNCEGAKKEDCPKEGRRIGCRRKNRMQNE